MPVLADRVQETTTTGGTGAITLAGAVTGYRSFAQAFSIGQETYYTIDNGSGEWEIGVGTVGSGTLSRDTVLESSNANALVNFSAGTKRVFCSAPTKVLLPDETGNSGKVLTTNGTDPAWTTTLNGMTIGNITPGTGAFTTLSASSTVSGTGFSTYLASPPAIGGTTPAAGAFTTLSSTGNTTLGDASADTLTINGTAVSIPNNLNFDSNTLFIDAANNQVGIGTSSPGAKLTINAGDGATALNQVTISGGRSLGAAFGSAGSILFTNGYWGAGYGAASICGMDSASAGGFLGFATTSNGSGTTGTPTERMRIDSSGNVGIGTSSPASYGKFVVSDAQNAGAFCVSSNTIGYSFLQLTNTGASGRSWQLVTGGSGSAYSGNLAVYDATAAATRLTIDSSGNLGLGVTPSSWSLGKVVQLGSYSALWGDGSTSTYLSNNVYYNGGFKYLNNGYASYYIQSAINGVQSWNVATSGTAGNAITFTTAMTLDASGRLIVGGTSLLVSGTHSFYGSSAANGPLTLRNDNSAAGRYHNVGPDANANFVIYNNATTGVYLSYGATSWTANSDERLKTGLKPILNAAQKVSTLRAVTGRYIADEEVISRAFLIAQDVQAVLPEAVDAADSEKLGIRYTDTIPLLVAAIQELTARLETLEAKVN